MGPDVVCDATTRARANCSTHMICHATKNTGRLQCKACASGAKKGAKCAQPSCRAFIPEAQLTRTQRNQRLRETVCGACKEEGYSAKNPTTYKCREPSCQYSGGRGQFQQTNFERDRYTAGLRCIECVVKPRSRKEKQEDGASTGR